MSGLVSGARKLKWKWNTNKNKKKEKLNFESPQEISDFSLSISFPPRTVIWIGYIDCRCTCVGRHKRIQSLFGRTHSGTANHINRHRCRHIFHRFVGVSHRLPNHRIMNEIERNQNSFFLHFLQMLWRHKGISHATYCGKSRFYFPLFPSFTRIYFSFIK